MSTYVLVHGAWHDGQAWSRVVPLLGAAGHRVYAPSLTGHGDKRHLLSPGVSLDTHIDDIVELLTSEDLTDVVLVGHSYAGMVITGVAERSPERVAQLVFVDAMVPVDGESALDIIPLTQSLIDQAATSDAPWRIPPLPARETGWFGVQVPDDIEWLRTFVGDEAIRCFTQPLAVGHPLADQVARVHIHCVVGKPGGSAPRPIAAVQPNGQPASVWQLNAAHDCMITAPTQLARLLLKTAPGA